MKHIYCIIEMEISMYQSLYRKYRPDTFEKVIGQDHITTALVNQIRTGNIAHAYLLTGTRGTGKTSVARIFARAINCLSPQNGSPCGECEICKKLLSATSLDIVEIDAASNNSVDDARAIRDSVRYAPIDCKYKVYIIDEVHQLSTAAFNALLKTLEEPPAHAVFILATTEVQKIPATILSRCLRLDFHLVPQNILEEHVKRIFETEGVQYTPEGISAIASAGEGSVRDTLSVADMCVSYSNIVDYDCVLGVLGANDPTVIASIAYYTLIGDVKKAVEQVESASALGKSIPLLTKDITRYFRDLNIIKHDSDANKILKLPDTIYNAAFEIAKKQDSVSLMRALDVFSEVEAKERYSTQPKILLETAIIKTATLSGEELADIIARVAKLESTVADIGTNVPAAPTYSAILQTLSPTVPAPSPAQPKAEEQATATLPAEEFLEKPKNETQVTPPEGLAMQEIEDLPFEVEAPVESIPVEAPQPVTAPSAAPQKEESSSDKPLTADDIKRRIPKEVRDEIKKLRGKIITKLRERKLLMVYLAVCEESTLIKVEQGKITLAFPNEMEYSYCNNQNAISVLKEIFREELNADFELSLITYGETVSKGLTNEDILKLFSTAESIRFRQSK